MFGRIRLKRVRNCMSRNHCANLSLPNHSDKYVSKPFGKIGLGTIRKHISSCIYLRLPHCTKTQIEHEITDSNQKKREKHPPFGAGETSAWDLWVKNMVEGQFGNSSFLCFVSCFLKILRFFLISFRMPFRISIMNVN